MQLKLGSRLNPDKIALDKFEYVFILISPASLKMKMKMHATSLSFFSRCRPFEFREELKLVILFFVRDSGLI